MRIEEAIVQRLDATPAVTTLATGGVWQLTVPQHEGRPSVRVQLIDEPRPGHLRGYASVLVARVQIDTFAGTTNSVPDAYTAVGDLAEAVAGALGPEPFYVGGSPALRVLAVFREDRQPFDPDEHGTYRMMQDFRVWFRQT